MNSNQNNNYNDKNEPFFNNKERKIISNQQSNPKEWGYRYSRTGKMKQSILNENEEFFADHIEHLKKRKRNSTS